jgi:hypothetical protein
MIKEHLRASWLGHRRNVAVRGAPVTSRVGRYFCLPVRLPTQNSEEPILGDIEEFEYGGRTFDGIVCWDILEHLKRPEKALANLMPTLDQGGVLIIKGPIPQSMQGLVTSLSPHWFHVLFYRWAFRNPNAGKPGYAPFKTEHTRGARPEAIRNILFSAGLEVLAFWVFETHANKIREKSKLLYKAYSLSAHALERVTGSRYGGIASDFVIVARRPLLSGGIRQTLM